MNGIVNKLLLEGDKFVPEMRLNQPSFTYKACSPFTKNKESIQKFMQTGNTNYIFRNDVEKACFDMVWLMIIINIWLGEKNQINF